MRKRINFENKVILSAVIITFVPLVLSYVIFVKSKLSDNNEYIKTSIKETGFSISQSEYVKKKLALKENDMGIQEYTERFIKNLKDIDIIVVADMTGEKYSHLDEKQIGEIYVNDDKEKALKYGSSYYSLMEGSMGTTLRWFEPIYYEGQQVGFVMVGKYYSDITIMNDKTKYNYGILFVFALSLSIVASRVFAKQVKRAMLDMEPDEIARVYNEKKIIINSVKDGVIALNEKNEITEINGNCFKLIDNFDVEAVLNKLNEYIKERKELEMKEFIFQGKKIFVTMKHIRQGENYLGVVITLIDKNDINKIAREITGVDEIVKNLRANVHEFKNNMHVILGLIQIKEYEEAKKYILKTQQIQENSTNKFAVIKDNYIRGLLLSRDLIAKERRVEFILREDSNLYADHGIIDSYDLVTILGNLIENAFEACSLEQDKNKMVEIYLKEDDKIIIIEVSDSAKNIEKSIRDDIFVEGVSSKGEGRGTGLYLVKNRVELYNGSIEIKELTGEKRFVITIYKGE